MSRSLDYEKTMFLSRCMGILALSFCLFTGVVQAVVNPEYEEIHDGSLRMAVQSMRAQQVHMTNFLFYTMNTDTPGFVEFGVYNENEGGNIEAVSFYRWRAGPPARTDRELDFYLDADSRGFWQIRIYDDHYAYTRDGRFTLDNNRKLRTVGGNYYVQGESGDIVLPEGEDIDVSRAGVIYVDGTRVDKFRIHLFNNSDRNKLLSLNGSYFVMNQPGNPITDTRLFSVNQYFREESNVLKALIGDITMANRTYETAAKAARALTKQMTSAAQMANP